MPDRPLRPLLLALAIAACSQLAVAQNAEKPKEDPPQLDTSRGDAMIADYFRRETKKLADACLADIQTADDWNAKKDEYRRQLREMLGLDPLPEKTDLKATVTGKLEHDKFTVEKLYFQSRPGLYVTGNLYVPKQSEGKLPAILYVCGHGNVKKDGISYGAKSHYQHHGAWFARNGYVCLVIDTLQLGEIEGIHHGTYRFNMWWWLNRGYTPAGVEAWNCVRALDYLQSRPEVDGEKLGVTGRSGGGAYSWWIAAIDERIKCAVPVAGITDLQNHVVDGCVEGHCDCMYMVNTYRWDYPQVAALVAPRPLLISNTDSDGIFPLDGVVRVFDKARRIYTLLGKRDQIGLNITSGGHKDTQELQVTALRWFNHHLKGYDGPVTNHAEKFFEPEQLKVFDTLPEDQINTKIHETFVAAAPMPKVPENKEEWERMREEWMRQLKEKCLRGWPKEAPSPHLRERFDVTEGSMRLRGYEVESQPGIILPLYVLDIKSAKNPGDCIFVVTGTKGMRDYLGGLPRVRFDNLPEEITSLPNSDSFVWGDPFPVGDIFDKNPPWKWGRIVFFAPRGEFNTAWDQSEKKQVQNRRRFMLLGQTLAAMQAWDVGRAVDAVQTVDKDRKFRILIRDELVECPTLLAAPQLNGAATAHLFGLRDSNFQAPAILNQGRLMPLNAWLSLAARQMPVLIETVSDENGEKETGMDLSYLIQVRERLGGGQAHVVQGGFWTHAYFPSDTEKKRTP